LGGLRGRWCGLHGGSGGGSASSSSLSLPRGSACLHSKIIITIKKKVYLASRRQVHATQKKPQNHVVRKYANHQFAFVHVRKAQLCHCSYTKGHKQCTVWKSLEELALQCKLVHLVVDISENLMEAICQNLLGIAMFLVTMHS